MILETIEHLNVFDYVIIVTILISVVVSITRGFLQEAISLLSWIAAAVLATVYYPRVSESIAGLIANLTFRNIISFISIVIVILIVGAIVNRLARKLTKASLSAKIDRILGLGFGLIRGIVLATIIALIGQAALFTDQSWWQHSQFIPFFQDLADYFMQQLPEEIRHSVESMLQSVSSE